MKIKRILTTNDTNHHERNPLAANKARPALERTLLSRAAGLPAQAAESRAKPKNPLTRGRAIDLKQLIHSLKLPQDGLSATLIRFARNFSLPLEPALLSRLRKEALTLKARQTGRGSGESAALAAVAAASKGVTLSEEALEQYARAMDPDYAADERDSSSPEHEDGQPADGEGGSFQNNNRDGGASQGRRDPADRDEAQEIREILGEALARVRWNGETKPGAPEEEPLLSLLNRLPDREGNLWVVIPFKINQENLEFRVSMWILLLYKDSFKFSTGRQYGDSVRGIVVNAAGKMRRWFFSVMNPGGPEAGTRVSVSPPYGEPVRKKAEREIREALGDFGGEVSLNGKDVSLISELWNQDAGLDWPFFCSAADDPPVIEEEA